MLVGSATDPGEGLSDALVFIDYLSSSSTPFNSQLIEDLRDLIVFNAVFASASGPNEAGFHADLPFCDVGLRRQSAECIA